jgi:predicted LPLAT superfamily acyltransferase
VKAPRDESAAGPRGWQSASERGSKLALGAAAWCFRRLGPRPLGLLLAPIAAYYTLFAAGARRASAEYLARLDRACGRAGARRSPWRDAYRHFHAFAEAILDRFSFWTGSYADFSIEIHGREHMEHLFRSGRGAVLLGAHLGSFDVLRVISRDADVRVNVLMFTGNATRINATLRALDPTCDVRLIEVDPHSVRSAFEVRRCVARGEFVAVLADRAGPGGRHQATQASFLGEQAVFPQGPFLLPMLLGLPTILSLALKTGPRRYDVFLETLAGAEAVPARERAKVLQERIETFASRLEHYCALAPYQWFNFYDFWAEGRRDAA